MTVHLEIVEVVTILVKHVKILMVNISYIFNKYILNSLFPYILNIFKLRLKLFNL